MRSFVELPEAPLRHSRYLLSQEGVAKLRLSWRSATAVLDFDLHITVHASTMSPELAMLVSGLASVHATEGAGDVALLGLHDLAKHAMFDSSTSSVEEAWQDFDAHFNTARHSLAL